jgi:hypothetical protein
MRGLIAGILISGLAFFGGYQIYKTFYPQSGIPQVDFDSAPAADRVDSQARTPSPGAIRFSNYKAIGEKSLFRPERREWNAPRRVERTEDAKPAPEKPKAPPPRLTLFGTIIFGDDVKIAIIKGEVGGKGPGSERESYRLGDEVAGYRIESIEEDGVMLVKGEEVIQLKLREGKQLPAAPAARQQPAGRVKRPAAAAGVRRPAAGVKKGGGPERIVVKGPGGREIIKRKKVIRTPFGPKTIYIEER